MASENINFSNVPAALLNVDLDNALLHHQGSPTPERWSDVARAWNAVPAALIFSPKVTFKVREANYALAALTDMFGVRGALQLLDSGSVDFLQWTQDFAFVEPDGSHRGPMPFFWMHWGHPLNNDVEAVAARGLELKLARFRGK